MKSPYLIIICLLLAGRAYSQDVDILRQSETFQRQGKHRQFIYWNNPSDTAGLEYVATLSSKASAMGGKSLWEIWNHAGNRSVRLGSNVFICRSFTDSSDAKAELILDLYLASEAALSRNTEREEKNVVYLFGNKGKPMPVKVNGEEVDIPANSFLRYETPPGSTLKLSKGGITGASWTIQGEEGKAPVFLSVSGPGLGGAVPPAGSVGISINSGRITPMHPQFGRMLLQLQKK
ncbi:hypothetical protein [Chitinophaga solisilvae]|uniref:Uncharacterized protein n=1 Tax=Chitinophaga solisilvae TaxID=1233460 RepID=A0A433W964_9BACT|nr:hypothetical protein [Chitinophaga solisilvae]NSL85879.1 hypothetical protein [Chitinophaga solisilvae]